MFTSGLLSSTSATCSSMMPGSSSYLNPLHSASIGIQQLPFFSILRRIQLGENSYPWKRPAQPSADLCGRRQSNLFISVIMRPTLLPLYAPTFLQLQSLAGWSPAHMLWLSSTCERKTSVFFSWGFFPMTLDTIRSVLLGPQHCTKPVSLVVPSISLGGGGPIPSSSTSRTKYSCSSKG